MYVCLQVCPRRSVMFYYVIGGGIAPLVYVGKGAAMCHCLCLFKSCQLFLCGVGAVLYCRAVAVCDAVAGPISVLYVSVVMCAFQCPSVWPSITTPLPEWGPREFLGMIPRGPLWSFLSSLSLPLPLPLTCWVAGRS